MSDALTPINDDSWSTQTMGSSRLAANVRCLDWPDTPTTTNLYLFVIQLCQVRYHLPGGSPSVSRRIVHYLANEGIPISRCSVRNLLYFIGLRAVDQKPRTTIPGSPSERFPCLVGLDKMTSCDQASATDNMDALEMALASGRSPGSFIPTGLSVHLCRLRWRAAGRSHQDQLVW